MQGVAAKNDASYDLSRARASVTGQTTIAASTAATPMTPPPSEKSGLAKDLIVILGLPALLLSAGTWYYWETILPVYRPPFEPAVFESRPGLGLAVARRLLQRQPTYRCRHPGPQGHGHHQPPPVE
jgi:hypothetical protein